MEIKHSRHYSDSRSCTEQGHAQSDQRSYCAPTPTLTKRLSWRTKADQFFQSFGCGQVHNIEFMGTCEACGRSVYSHGCQGAKPCGDTIDSSPDPRGIIPPEHCMNLYHANEYGMKGRDLITCYSCSEDGDRYRAIIAQAKYKGIWIAPDVIGYLCAVCGKSGPECTGHLAGPNTHKFVCGEDVTQQPTPGHRYELHTTNTHETDEHGHRYKWCVYDYFDVNGRKRLSFWYFVTKQNALQQYPEVTL